MASSFEHKSTGPCPRQCSLEYDWAHQPGTSQPHDVPPAMRLPFAPIYTHASKAHPQSTPWMHVRTTIPRCNVQVIHLAPCMRSSWLGKQDDCLPRSPHTHTRHSHNTCACLRAHKHALRVRWLTAKHWHAPYARCAGRVACMHGGSWMACSGVSPALPSNRQGQGMSASAWHMHVQACLGALATLITPPNCSLHAVPLQACPPCHTPVQEAPATFLTCCHDAPMHTHSGVCNKTDPGSHRTSCQRPNRTM